MKRNILFFIIVALALGSCDERKIPLYGEDSYIYFTKTSDDTTRFSFITVPGEDEYLIPLQVEIMGRTPVEDLAYAVQVETEKGTTAASGSYSVPKNPVFRAGRFVDTLYVTLIKTPELDTKTVNLTLEIVGNANYGVGPATNAKANISFSNIKSRPSWWTEAFVTGYLGLYSDLKYEHFIIATGVSDITGLGDAELKGLCRQFYWYLMEKKDQGNELVDENGPMLNTLGNFM